MIKSRVIRAIFSVSGALRKMESTTQLDLHQVFQMCHPNQEGLISLKKLQELFRWKIHRSLFRLSFLEFEKLTDATSKLTIQTIYKSADFRDQHLRMPFAQGINMAHNRLQELLGSR